MDLIGLVYADFGTATVITTRSRTEDKKRSIAFHD